MAINGEPGIAWLDNMRAWSRMRGDVLDNMVDTSSRDYKDFKAGGGNPCLEQTLESFELCCLVETFPAHHDDLDDFLMTARSAFEYGT